MNKTITRLASAATAAVSLATISLAMAGPASAAVTQVPSGPLVSPFWAGYYAVPASGQSPEAVFGSFTVPRVDCARSIGLPQAHSGGSMWVGIGGSGYDVRNGKDAWLEQAGVQVHCASWKSQPVYEPFWEIAPPDSDKNPKDHHGSQVFTENGSKATVSPGDHVTAVVYYNGYLKTGKFTFQVNVDHPGTDPVTYYQTTDIPAGAYPGRTAEVITERSRGPSGPAGLDARLARHGPAGCGQLLQRDVPHPPARRCQAGGRRGGPASDKARHHDRRHDRPDDVRVACRHHPPPALRDHPGQPGEGRIRHPGPVGLRDGRPGLS